MYSIICSNRKHTFVIFSSKDKEKNKYILKHIIVKLFNSSLVKYHVFQLKKWNQKGTPIETLDIVLWISFRFVFVLCS